MEGCTEVPIPGRNRRRGEYDAIGLVLCQLLHNHSRQASSNQISTKLYFVATERNTKTTVGLDSQVTRYLSLQSHDRLCNRSLLGAKATVFPILHGVDELCVRSLRHDASSIHRCTKSHITNRDKLFRIKPLRNTISCCY